MTKPVYTALMLAAGALVLAWVLNPSPERHRARIAEAMAEHSSLAEVLGIGQLTAFTSTYHSLGGASCTNVGDRTVLVRRHPDDAQPHQLSRHGIVNGRSGLVLIRDKDHPERAHRNPLSLSRSAGNAPLIADAANRRGRSQRGVAG